MNPDKNHLYQKEHRQQVMEESPLHRRKSKTAATSSSRKRADHKHCYETIILHFGGSTFVWGRRCIVCGRIDDSYKASNWGDEALRATGVGFSGSFSECCLAEIHQRHPEYAIMTLQKAQWQQWTADSGGKEPI